MILYKYRNFSTEARHRTLEIITKQELFFAGITSFNDPFDGRVHLRFDGKINEIKAAQIRAQYCMKLLKEDKYEGAKFEDIKRMVDDKFTTEFINDVEERTKIKNRVQEMHNKKGVLSMSTKNDNILMWSHYTYNHKGLCFGFEFSENAFASAKRVKYQTHYDDIWGWLHTDEEIVERILYSKAIDWQYEDEYRIVRETIGVEKFKPESLKEIVFGSMMSEIDKNLIIDECKKKSIFPRYKQAYLDVETYKINIRDHKIT